MPGPSYGLCKLLTGYMAELRQLIRGALCLLLVAGLLAGFSGWLQPWSEPVLAGEPGERLGVAEARARVAAGESILWVDARPEAAFLRGHVPGAVWLSEDDWSRGLMGLLEIWEPDQVIVVYCDGVACAASGQVAARLRDELGVDTVLVLEGGWEAWQNQ